MQKILESYLILVPSVKDTETSADAFICSRLDYAIYLYMNQSVSPITPAAGSKGSSNLQNAIC